MSLARYIADTWRAEDVLEIDAPWEPDGTIFRLTIRPDSYSQWCEAREKAGVSEPQTLADRLKAEAEEKAAERRRLSEEAKAQAKGKRRPVQAAEAMRLAEAIDEMAAKPSELPDWQQIATEHWDPRYPIYTGAEVKALRELVGLHLVVRVETRRPRKDATGKLIIRDGEPSCDVEEWSREEITSTFSETALIPSALPGAPDDAVEMAGYEEGSAWAILVLRHAIQDHLFLERQVPLDSASSASQRSPDTSEEPRTPTRLSAVA